MFSWRRRPLLVDAHGPGSGTTWPPGMPSVKLLVEPDHVAVRQAVFTLVRVIPFLSREVIALDAPEAESRFLVEGDLADAGVAGADHHAADAATAQVGQNLRQHAP